MAARTIPAEPKGRMAGAYPEDDASLMARVAEARDAEAFAELLRRHKAAAFNLARYLTRNRDEAEEVLQDAFLRVWRHSRDFNAEGCARNWLLKIVARETFRQRTRKRSNEEKKVRAQNRGGSRTADAPDQSAERDELLGALRVHLQDLPEEERRAVALYYGAGCTQEEIGKALDCSQNKISYILNQALGKLRARLTEAGYAAALPLLAQDGLQNAICGGSEAPAGVAKAVLRSLKAGVESAEHSRRAAAATSGSGVRVFVVVALVLATAGAWWGLQEGPAAPITPAAQSAPTGTFEPDAKSVSSGVEILYEDAFDGENLDPFWETIEPPAQDGYFRCWVMHGGLVLFAGAQNVRTDLLESAPNNPSGNYRVFPEVSLSSKPVALNGSAILYQLISKKVIWHGAYELRIDVLDEAGNVLGGHVQLRDSEDGKEPAIHRHLGPTRSAGPGYTDQDASFEPASDTVGILIDPAGRIGEVDSEGGRFFYEGAPRASPKIRLRLTVKIRGAEGHAMWVIGQARVTRVRGWNDPQALRALGRMPWSSEKK